jgi:hypothetical protein
MTSSLSLMELDCPPRWGTPRSPERATLGGKVGEVGRLLRKEFMPWQQHVADITGELDPKTGRLAYDEVVALLPRQSGKTTIIMAKAIHRSTATGFYGTRQRLIYTAQTRLRARKKLEQEFEPTLLGSPSFAHRVQINHSHGDEHILFRNGSLFGIDAVTETAGHGDTLDEAYIDEAFAQRDSRLEVAFGPAMITRPNKQLWVISTAGWLGSSPYLEEKVRVGRRAVEEGRRSGLAYFEWSAPDDCDPGDESVWWNCMPALGYTITVAAIRREYQKAIDGGKLNEFKRSFLNLWVPKTVDDARLIPSFKWADCSDVDSQMATSPRFALDVSPMSNWAAIGAAGLRSDGLVHAEITSGGGGQLVDHRPGTDWLVPRLVELAGNWDNFAIHIAHGSPAMALKPDIEAAGVRVVVIPANETNTACGLIFNRIVSAALRHIDQEPLNGAVAAVQKTETDGAWRFARRRSTSDITPLYAITWAVWAVVENDDEIPVAMFGGDLEVCDSCGNKPHHDPNGEHDYLCAECRDEEDEWA